MNRRGLLALGLVLMPGDAAPPGFAGEILAAGQRLVLRGAAASPHGCRAALYAPEVGPGDGGGVALVEARFQRARSLAAVVAGWEERLGGTLPPPFRAWLRPVQPGDVERQLFLPDAVELDGPDRLPRRVEHAGFARDLLAAWTGQRAGHWRLPRPVA